jgi:nuclear GTP-binding protein
MQRGVLDHAGAARIVLRDWSIGKFARYTMPPGSSTATSSSANDEGILATLKSRKELRKAEDVKLVRLEPGEAEKREVKLDDVWVVDEEVSEDEVDDEDAGDEEASGDEDSDEAEADQGSGSEKDEEEDVEDDEEEAPELLPPPKRKRTVSFAVGGKRQRKVRQKRL